MNLFSYLTGVQAFSSPVLSRW